MQTPQTSLECVEPPVLLENIYSEHIERENEENRKNRYEGNEHYYHASGAGTCSRKLYFQSVVKAEATNPATKTGARIMRLGTLLHNDFEKALLPHTIPTIHSTIYSNSNEYTVRSYLGEWNFFVEEEVLISELNVRGFYDALAKKNSGELYLFDLKSAADYSFKLQFGMGKRTHMKHQEMQLATYGYAIKEKYGRLDGMYLAYYNKNTSVMKYKEVPLSTVSMAYMFWANVKKEHSSGLPSFVEAVSPVQKWECNYCQFYDLCKPPYKRIAK